MTQDPSQRQKIKRLWRDRSLLSLGFLCLIGFATLRVPIILEQQTRYQQAQLQLQASKLTRLRQERMMDSLQQELKQLWSLDQVREQLQEQLRLGMLMQVQELRISEENRIMHGYAREHGLEGLWLLAQEQEQEQVWMHMQVLEQKVVPVQLVWRVALSLPEQKQVQVSILERRMSYEFIGLGATAFGGLVLLLLLLLQRDRTGIPLTGHLVLVLPEECVAELAALLQRLKKQQHPGWFVRFRLVQETLALMVGVYVQINFDNWRLPGAGSSRRIDDE